MMQILDTFVQNEKTNICSNSFWRASFENTQKFKI